MPICLKQDEAGIAYHRVKTLPDGERPLIAGPGKRSRSTVHSASSSKGVILTIGCEVCPAICCEARV